MDSVSAGQVTISRTPDHGIQPQAEADSKGIVHLIYYQGDPAGGDVFYSRRLPGNAEFSKPLKVNSQVGSAMAMGTIRGAQLAVGRNSRVHVVWNGMGRGARRVSINGKETAPLLYTRLNDQGTGFEPERNLIHFAAGLDGGSSVAADSQGNVCVTWHAAQPGKGDDEAGRAVFISRSQDDGKTFGRETTAVSQSTGACPCCGMRAFADSSGATYILFRAATDGSNRDALLLVSERPGAPFTVAHADKWKIGTCPMSSATLTRVDGGALAAWETAGQVFCATVQSRTSKVSTALFPPGEAVRKHPVAVANGKGEILLVWTEGTSWGNGGVVAWQLYTRDGKLASEKGRAEGLPAWSLATAYATGEDFSIVY